MADTTTELEVLDEIVDVLGGQSGQYETVVPVLRQIKELLGGALGSGYNPSLSVGRADALTGADETAQWATRESTGSGSATVRSVQGAAVGWNQLEVTPYVSSAVDTAGLTIVVSDDYIVSISGTTTAGNNFYFCTDAGGSANSRAQIVSGHKYLMKGIERFQASSLGCSLNVYYDGRIRHTLRGNEFFTAVSSGLARVYLNVSSSDITVDFVGRPQLFDLTAMFGSGNEPQSVAEFERMFPEPYYPYSVPTLKPAQIAGIASTDAQGGELDAIEWSTQTLRAAGSVRDELTAGELVTRVGVRAYQSGDENDATVRTDGTTTYYPLATPTTTPISPTLPMTYRVQQGGTESIIVPEGEISAAPVLTIAEGESASDVVMDALACIATPDGPTATANHSVGTYLTMQGKLYKVTSAIAVGESIVAGTNVTQTTVMSELLALTA